MKEELPSWKADYYRTVFWLEKFFIIAGMIASFRYGYSLYREYYPAPEDAMAQLAIERAVSEWSVK